jgi:uncharacterized membrane protein
MAEMSMVERVARAMCEAAEEDWDAASYLDTASGNAPEDQRDYWRVMARAAIEEMRTPTDEMRAAADNKVRPDSDNLQCPDWYTAAIDAALSDTRDKG